MKTTIIKDSEQCSILVTRTYQAEKIDVWNAFTDRALLDQWWGPNPWKCETQHQQFEVFGFWHFAMVGPEGEKGYGRINYTAIDTPNSFDYVDQFSDENAGVNSELPVSNGKAVFSETNEGIKVEFTAFYNSAEDMQTVVEMGFEEGITSIFEQLAELLKK